MTWQCVHGNFTNKKLALHHYWSLSLTRQPEENTEKNIAPTPAGSSQVGTPSSRGPLGLTKPDDDGVNTSLPSPASTGLLYFPRRLLCRKQIYHGRRLPCAGAMFVHIYFDSPGAENGLAHRRRGGSSDGVVPDPGQSPPRGRRGIGIHLIVSSKPP